MKMTPQMYAAAGLLFFALLFATQCGSITSGVALYPIDDEAVLSLEVSAKNRAVFQAEEAKDPVVEAFSGQRPHNPWNLKAERIRVQTTIPDPPPPSLASPDPVILPLPKE